MVNAENYTIEIRKGDFGLDGSTDICYRGNVKEFDYLEEYSDTALGAYELVVDSINQTLLHLVETCQEIPKPLPLD